jgi:polysaccharide pyruvyl transferase WcaK-like protein
MISKINKKILVYGFYYKNNIGDNLFIDAFKYLFPDVEFLFVSKITLSNLTSDISTVFIGGGSFLNAPIDINTEIFNLLKTKNILYIGVGGETNIHQTHNTLLSLAKLIVIRTPNHLDKIKLINKNVIYAQDLVYSLSNILNKQNKSKIDKSVLILPNAYNIPNNTSPHWSHLAFSVFKSEFSQFLDNLIENNYKINFFPMSTNNIIDDNWAAIHIISSMKNRNNSFLIKEQYNDIQSLIDLFSKYEVIITQRFHGIVLADMALTPCISIYHHDKLLTNTNISMPYYGFSKQSIIDNFNQSSLKTNNYLLDNSSFLILKDKVNKIIGIPSK